MARPSPSTMVRRVYEVTCKTCGSIGRVYGDGDVTKARAMKKLRAGGWTFKRGAWRCSKHS